MDQSASSINETYYDEFWKACPDFSRFNPGTMHRWRAILARLRRFPFRTLLDVGCGDAELIAWLCPKFSSESAFSGADLSSRTIESNRVRFPKAEFHVLNIEEDHLPGTYDAVVCSEVVEHLDHRQAAISNLAAMVAPGGHLIITCPTGKVHATDIHFGHTTHPTASELRRFVTEAGLDVVSIDNWGFPFYTALKYATNIFPKWSVNRFATGTYGPVARIVSSVLYYVNFLNVPTSPFGCQLFLVARRAK
jgi:2-polyprenyl-3-methyl-5-hydroxy-6-metoxy-1,4-benzoquinol methylase